MTNHRNGPPKRVGPRDTTPEGTDTSSQATTAHQRSEGTTAHRACITWRTGLRRRRDASLRLVALDCGCRDPWPCRCTVPPLSDRSVDAGRAAALHVLEQGHVPLLEIEILRALYRRGGLDRQLAEQLHRLTGGRAA